MVLVHGEVTVFEARGQFQIIVRKVELQGRGALQAKFEQLKDKLNEEGLFAAERKRALPTYPARVAIVTSPTGAALRDVLHVIERRNPSLELVLVPCRVQGEGAADEIVAAVRRLNDWSYRNWDGLDLILLTRGGGSLEDLWAFNEEVLARTIAESKLPIVSAVGHEIDFMISDLVADFRAATPSAAAELITEGVFASRDFIRRTSNQLNRLANERTTWPSAILDIPSTDLAKRIRDANCFSPASEWTSWPSNCCAWPSGEWKAGHTGCNGASVVWSYHDRTNSWLSFNPDSLGCVNV